MRIPASVSVSIAAMCSFFEIAPTFLSRRAKNEHVHSFDRNRGKVGEMNTLLAIETLTQAGILTVVRADELLRASSVVARWFRGASTVALKS